ncbi:MAG: folA [Paenibacillus sp.]|jgi:dihydrofolate reductase|nr:folA [Paenibacillus sp.]
MRKIIVGSFITLDGVMQAPGAPEDGFKYGGWSAPYYDEALDKIVEKQKQLAADLLLGRKTFEIFANFFPEHADIWPEINDVTKYVMSSTLEKSDWKNSVFLKSVEDIEKLKKSEGSDLQVHGSGNLIQTLLKHDLVDELWLLIHPLTLGTGKKLFDDGTIPAAFTLLESTATPSGVIAAHYKRAGEVKTGTLWEPESATSVLAYDRDRENNVMLVSNYASFKVNKFPF